MTDETVRRPGGRAAPIACNLAALGPAQRDQRARLAASLQAGVVEVIELPDGFALHLDPRSGIAREIDEFIRLEQACCPFLTFRRHSGAHIGGLLALEITGGEGVKQFLVSQFGVTGSRG